MDRYFRRLLTVLGLARLGTVSIHLLWTGTLEEFPNSRARLLIPCFNPSFMDRYFRSAYLRRATLAGEMFQSIFYGQVL